MAILYIVLSMVVFLGSIFSLIALLSLLRRARAARHEALRAGNTPMTTPAIALMRLENDVPVVLPFISSDSYDDTQPIVFENASQDDFIPLVEGVDEEPTHPTLPPRAPIEHDPELPAFTITPDDKFIDPQRENVARLIAFFKEKVAETAP